MRRRLDVTVCSDSTIWAAICSRCSRDLSPSGDRSTTSVPSASGTTLVPRRRLPAGETSERRMVSDGPASSTGDHPGRQSAGRLRGHVPQVGDGDPQVRVEEVDGDRAVAGR